MLSKTISQLKLELKHNFPLEVFVYLVIMGITYFAFGVKNLDTTNEAMIVERFLPLSGIFSFVTLFYAECQSPIKDLLLMRNTMLEYIYVLRGIVRLFFYGGMTFSYIYLINSGATSYSLMRVVFHSLSIGVIIGVIGLLFFSFSNNISLAFLVSIGLMLAQWFAPKNTNALLFTMPEISNIRIVLIFTISIMIVILAMVIWKRKAIS
ncbi:hypothetical protein ACQV2S_08270 [Facklamia sp. P13064]|uniref:hypothetical protein n=1 Tax=unclassified Facklamia TaxID=2622293 RepID=UPI003D169586